MEIRVTSKSLQNKWDYLQKKTSNRTSGYNRNRHRNSADKFNYRLDTTDLVNWKVTVKKLFITQQKEEVIRTIIKRVRDMEDKGKRFNKHLVRGLEEKKEWIEEMLYLKGEWLRTDDKMNFQIQKSNESQAEKIKINLYLYT